MWQDSLHFVFYDNAVTGSTSVIILKNIQGVVFGSHINIRLIQIWRLVVRKLIATLGLSVTCSILHSSIKSCVKFLLSQLRMY